MRTIQWFALAIVCECGFMAAGECCVRGGPLGPNGDAGGQVQVAGNPLSVGTGAHEIRPLGTTTFTVTVCTPVNGAVIPIPGPHTYDSQIGAISIQAIPAASYRLQRWVVSGGVRVADATAARTTMTLTGDGTLCPEFEKLVYTVNIGAPVNGSVSPSPGPHTYDAGAGPIALQATPAASYRFKGWVATGGVTVATRTAATTTMTVTGDGTLSAEFEKMTATVNICTPAHGSIDPAPGNHTHTCGTAIPIRATPAACYRFKQWIVGGGVSVANTTAADTFLTIAGDGTLCAEFEKMTGTVSVCTPVHGDVSPSPGDHTYECGATVSIRATAAACYGFTRWRVSGDLSVTNAAAANTTMTVTGDGTLGAEFDILTCTVSVIAPLNGSVAPAPGDHTYDCGAALSILATPASCYQFRRWVVSGGVSVASTTAASTIMTVTDAGTLCPEFEKASCSIQIESPVGGWVVPSPGPYTYECGSQAAVRAVPDPDHEFQQWAVSGGVTVDHATSDQARITVTGAGTLQAVFVAQTHRTPGLLGRLDFTDPLVSAFLVTTNDAPGLTYADRVTGLQPDPTGMLRLRVMENLPAQAKGRFAQSNAGAVLVRFQYLFPSITPSELTAYLSDVPDPLDPNDPLRVRHYVSLGRIVNPQLGRPGAPGSGRFGVFEAWAPVGSLDLSQGTWVELDLAGIPAEDGTSSGSVYTDNWTVEADAGLGVLEMGPNNAVTPDLLILGKTRMSSASAFDGLPADCFSFFTADGAYAGSYATSGALPTRCNVRLVRGPAGDLYVVNTERGLARIDGSVQTLVPPGEADYADEPRYHRPAKVYVGLQGDGSNWFGRPLLDAAVAADPEGRTCVYVVPVVVQPAGKAAADAYEAAARLTLNPPGSDPPYQVSLLYDDPCRPGDDQRGNALREIEVDCWANVYVLSVQRLNGSCILWQYASGDELCLLRRVHWQGPRGPATPVQAEDPVTLHIGADGQTLYVACGRCNPTAPGAATLYGRSTQTLAPVRTITIQNMSCVTAIADDPATGALWVAGVTLPEALAAWPAGQPDYQPDLASPEPFYVPVLATVPPGADVATASSLADPATPNLALPTSLVGTGP